MERKVESWEHEVNYRGELLVDSTCANYKYAIKLTHEPRGRLLNGDFGRYVLVPWSLLQVHI
jgi:hypothetical protein